LIESADGNRIVTLGEDNTVRIWDVPAAKQRRKVSLPSNTEFALLLGPDRILLRDNVDFLSVWDSENEKKQVAVQHVKKAFCTSEYGVSRDGKSLLVVDYECLNTVTPKTSTLYNLETGAIFSGVEKNWTQEKGEMVISVAHAYTGHSAVATIAKLKPLLSGTTYRCLLRCKHSEKDAELVWETKATELGDICRAFSFTPDDRSIMTFNSEKTTWVSLLESVTGNERCRFQIPLAVHPGANYVYSFSRNGDLLSVGTAGGKITVIDIRLGKEIATLRGDQGEIRSLAFGADMATLFAGGSDGTVLIWDLSQHIRKARQAAELSTADVKRLWTEMADPITIKAYRAVGTLVTAPTETVDLFREKVRPVPKATAAEIDKLIADLDNDDFDTRDKASRELRRIGVQAKAALQKNLENSKSREQHRRVEQLLAEVKERETTPSLDELRELRAVEVLEAIGTAPAWSILESLAKGPSGIKLTDEASYALKRRHKE
jgi:hypothetical protein